LKKVAGPAADWGPVHSEDRIGTRYEHLNHNSAELSAMSGPEANGVVNGGYGSAPDASDSKLYPDIKEAEAPPYTEASQM